MQPDGAALALARFGLGPRPGDTARIAADPQRALIDELQPETALLDGATLPTTAQALTALRRLQKARKKERAAPPSTRAMAASANAPAKPRKIMDAPQRIYRAEFAARLDRVGSAGIGYVERLTAFWTNHFAIGVSVGQVERVLVGAFEREAIRPHVLGRFEDMLFAVTRHPAMLAYLNNNVSVGPDSPIGKRLKRGINENLGRELMELHTIGVDGGYTQADVIALAKILTGWTFAYDTRGGTTAGSFLFRRAAHEPGPQTLMGKVYAEPGEQQGIAAIADLAAKPATARHIATKLAKSFVSDNPPATLVDRLASDFTDTGGDLMSLSRTLVESPESWTEPGKFRTPQEFLWASMRALDARPKPALALRILKSLGELPWNPPSPAGYSPSDAAWLAPDAMTGRLDAAERLAQRAAPGLRPDELATDLLAGRLSLQTLDAVAHAESKTQAYALLLMSPEFQRS